jgi:transposase
VESRSRMPFLEFTHSQSFETFIRCHVHAFTALGGVAREIAYLRQSGHRRCRTPFHAAKTDVN